MAQQADWPKIDLPRGWPWHVKWALLHVISLGQYAVAYTRGWAIDGRIARLRLEAESEQLRQRVTPLAEEAIHLVLVPIILTLGASDGCPPCLGPATPQCSETGSGPITRT